MTDTAVSPFDLIREALDPDGYLAETLDYCRDRGYEPPPALRPIAALDQLQRDHEALTNATVRPDEWVDEAGIRDVDEADDPADALDRLGYVLAQLPPVPEGKRSVAVSAMRLAERLLAERDAAVREAETLREAVELALSGLPDPMHPGIPRHAVDGLVAAKIVLMDALGDHDPGNVEAARATLASSRDTTETTT